MKKDVNKSVKKVVAKNLRPEDVLVNEYIYFLKVMKVFSTERRFCLKKRGGHVMLKNAEGDERKSFVVTLTNLQQTCEKCAKLSQDGGKSAEFEKERKAFVKAFFADNNWPAIEEIKETAKRRESLNDFFKKKEDFTVNKKAFMEFTGKLCEYAKAIAGEDKVQQKIDEVNNELGKINKRNSKNEEQKKIDNGTPKSKKDNACCIVF